MISRVKFLDACYNGELDLLEKYIEAGDDINVTSDSGNTGLRSSCVADRHDIVLYLLAKGAEPNQEIWLKSRVNDVFLCEKGFAIFYARSEKVVDSLIEYGAELSVHDKYGVGVLEWWQKLGRDDEFIASYF